VASEQTVVAERGKIEFGVVGSELTVTTIALLAAEVQLVLVFRILKVYVPAVETVRVLPLELSLHRYLWFPDIVVEVVNVVLLPEQIEVAPDMLGVGQACAHPIRGKSNSMHQRQMKLYKFFIVVFFSSAKEYMKNSITNTPKMGVPILGRVKGKICLNFI